MERHTIIKTVIGATLLGSALVMTARSDTAAIDEAPAPPPRRVELAPVTVEDAHRTLQLAGVTRSAERARLSFPIPARVASRPVEVGDRVRSGQTVATLDDREFRLAEQAAAATLAELDIRLAQARREEGRTERLAAAEAADLTKFTI